jgi:hypothetical protein
MAVERAKGRFLARMKAAPVVGKGLHAEKQAGFAMSGRGGMRPWRRVPQRSDDVSGKRSVFTRRIGRRGGPAAAGRAGAGGVAARGRCHAGKSLSRRTIGCPQQGQRRAGAGAATGVSGAAASGGSSVCRAICSRLAFAAG